MYKKQRRREWSRKGEIKRKCERQKEKWKRSRVERKRALLNAVQTTALQISYTQVPKL